MSAKRRKITRENGEDPQELAKKLLSASRAGDVHVVRELLAKGVSVNSRDGTATTTVLHWAIFCERNEVAQLLLENGADVDAVDNEGCTALFIACMESNLESVQLLLDKGADIETKGVDDEKYLRPLSMACAKGDEAIVRCLVEHGANLEATSKNPTRTALGWAASGGHEQVVRYLLEQGASFNARPDEIELPLCIASHFGHVQIVRLLLDYGDDPNAEYFLSGTTSPPLVRAARKGEHETVLTLLEAGADPNIKNSASYDFPLGAAIGSRNTQVVSSLLTYGASTGTTQVGDYPAIGPLFLACLSNQAEIIEVLLRFGANVNETNRVVDANGEELQFSPLSSTCVKGYLQVAKLLLENGADINLATGTTTPLRAAIIHAPSNSEAVRFLLDHGANPNELFHDGFPCLVAACLTGKLIAVRHLLEAGADMNRPGPDGVTPLIAASAEGHVELVQELLKQGANVYSADVRGETALLWAHEYGHTDVFFLLLRTSPQVWPHL